MTYADRQQTRAERTGFERTQENTGETTVSVEGGAESGALDAENLVTDPDLAAVIAAWPTLSEANRTAILAIINTDR